MSARSRMRSLLRNLLSGTRVDRDLDDELRGYVELLADEKIASGIPEEQARRLARMEVGGMETVKAEVRSIRSGAWIEGILQDVRYGVRGLRRAPVFTLAVVTTLALGIGANTAVFSAIDALLLRPLPVADPDRLVAAYRGASGTEAAFSFPEFERLAAQAHVFDGLAAWATHVTWLRTGTEVDRASLQLVSPAFFQVLGVTPAAGRTFDGTDAGAVGQAVISDRLWRSRFAADPSVLGRTLTLGTQPVTIIGVAPASFIGLQPASPADAWITFSTLALLEPGWDFRDGREYWIRLAGRLQPGRTVEAANAALRGVAVAATAPGSLDGAVRVVPAATAVFDPASRSSASRLAWLVAAIAGFVLVIACANVANLLIVRGAARRRDLGVRLAIGASRGRVVRQAIAETSVLCLAGWLTGLAVAHWTIQAIIAFAPASAIPPGVVVALDARVLAFAAALTVVTGVMFSSVPALNASRADLTDVIKTAAGGHARGGAGLRRGLVVLQVALSAVLLVGAGLFLRTLSATLAMQPGYDVDRVLLTTIDFTAANMPPATARAAASQIRERVAALPAVERVAWGQIVPFSGAFVQRPAIPEGRSTDASREDQFLVPYSVVSDGYFQTLGMPLRGRDFSPADGPGSPPVVIVNETLARRHWLGEDAIGKRLIVPGEPDARVHQVIGVVPDGKYVTLTEAQHPYMYLPLAQNHRGRLALHVRTQDDGVSLFGVIRSTVRSVHQDVASYNPLRLRDYVDRSVAQPRVVARLLALFGGIALLVAAVGVYGLTAYTVVRRTREIGVRIALGARPGDLVRMLVTQAAVLVCAGLVIGAAAAILLARAVQTLLFGVTPSDPLTFAGTGVVLIVTLLVATIVPAMRAASVDPVTALRVD